jgi:hypothetical protein
MLNMADSRAILEFRGKTWQPCDWCLADLSGLLCSRPAGPGGFAKASPETCQKNNLSGLLISAYEGMARAYVVAHEYRLGRESIDKARQLIQGQVVDEEDVRTYSDQIDETELMMKK